MSDQRNHKRRIILIAAICFVALNIDTSAHTQLLHADGPLPSFEVATIKPVQQGGPPIAFVPVPQNIFKNINSSARDLIRIAYGLPIGPASGRVLGGPDWVDSKRYEVTAKIPDALFAEMQKMPPLQRRDQMLLMAQSLLAGRFKLKVHFETHEMPIYELVIAKGGPKLIPAKEPPPEPDKPLPPPGPNNPPKPENLRQGILVLRKTPATSEMTAKGQTLDAFVQIPFFNLGSPIVNKTGLTGKYDFLLDWAPEQPVRPATNDAAAPTEPDAPPLFTALQEQLGLKLVQTKGPVEFIVIDHIEPPTEN